MVLPKELFWISIKIDFSHFSMFLFFVVGSHKKKSSKLKSSHFSICSSFSFILIYHIFDFYYYFPSWARTLVVYTKIIDQKYLIQHSRNLVYHHHPLIHHLQVITHWRLSRIDLIINTLLSIRTRTSYQIQMTSIHV